MNLTTFTLTLGDEKFFRRDVPKIRGYFASKFPQYIELHHHIAAKKYVYGYPLIQYKVINYAPTIIGAGEGVEVLKKIHDQVSEIQIDGVTIPIREKQMLQKEQPFGLCNELHFYKFIIPWLGLNQKNYKIYLTSSREKKFELLNRILIGNLLSMSKSFGYTVPDKIVVSADTRLRLTKLKGMDMSGFTGFFAANFQIPDLLGIGKSVSRGFGTVKKITLEELAKFY
ncbi:CRISPR-associated endonuclease Cas6 [candidate division KSB1 bacterium]|nr:CRISPR-associated endonuclease Cas6 [candidate division KSB1 bacterium]